MKQVKTVRRLIKILVEISLFFAKIIILVRKIIIGLFKNVLAKPVHFILRLIYHISVLPLYWAYLFLSKKIGWRQSNSARQFFINLLANKKLIHILIVVLTIALLWRNLTTTSDAIASEEIVGKTILAQLVTDELTQQDELIEEYSDEGIITPTTTNYLDRFAYLQPQLNIATHASLDVLEEFGSGDINVVVPPGESVIATSKTVEPRNSVVDYTIQAGDTISTIAQQFGISVNTILWENNLTAYSYIKPGQQLSILPESGVRHKIQSGDSLLGIAKKYDADTEAIMRANGLTNANQLKIGQLLMIPGGVKLKTVAAAQPRVGSPVAVFTDADDSAKPVYGSKMNWPTQGHRITQYYSWRHTGLDIANKSGTPIYAADAGTVETVGWNSGGYGNQIVIDHGGGKKTRYAHLTSFGIKDGESVSKGQYIGAMGSTGRSTGSHLHFEVIIEGKRYNPLNYVEY